MLNPKDRYGERQQCRTFHVAGRPGQKGSDDIKITTWPFRNSLAPSGVQVFQTHHVLNGVFDLRSCAHEQIKERGAVLEIRPYQRGAGICNRRSRVVQCHCLSKLFGWVSDAETFYISCALFPRPCVVVRCHEFNDAKTAIIRWQQRTAGFLFRSRHAGYGVVCPGTLAFDQHNNVVFDDLGQAQIPLRSGNHPASAIETAGWH